MHREERSRSQAPAATRPIYTAGSRQRRSLRHLHTRFYAFFLDSWGQNQGDLLGSGGVWNEDCQHPTSGLNGRSHLGCLEKEQNIILREKQEILSELLGQGNFGMRTESSVKNEEAVPSR